MMRPEVIVRGDIVVASNDRRIATARRVLIAAASN